MNRLSSPRLIVTFVTAFCSAIINVGEAHSQLAQDDMVIGRTTATSNYRVYDKSAAAWSEGPGWSPQFVQSIEFDNGKGVSHNASGNLFGANFGNGFTGFEMLNLASNGSAASQSVWSIVEATGGTKGMNPSGNWLSIRGGGLSFSPDNSKVAWAAFDPDSDGSASIYVHDYQAGATLGTGTGATVSGPRRTALGNGQGNSGSFAALRAISTQGTTWLNNTTVAAFNGFGEIITLDVAGIPGGTENGTLAGWKPTLMTNWKVANNQVALGAQSTDIEYNPLIDPHHIYASVVRIGAIEAELFAYDYNQVTGNISLNRRMVVPNTPNGQPRQPREIAFDSQGNLYYSGFAGNGSDNLVMKFVDATDIDNWDPAKIQVFFTSVDDSSFNGLDVALSLPIPEPGSFGLLILGCAMTFYRVRVR